MGPDGTEEPDVGVQEDGGPVWLPGVGRVLAFPPRDAAGRSDPAPVPVRSRRSPQVTLPSCPSTLSLTPSHLRHQLHPRHAPPSRRISPRPLGRTPL